MNTVTFSADRCVYEVVHVAQKDAPMLKDRMIQLVQAKTDGKKWKDMDASGKGGGST